MAQVLSVDLGTTYSAAAVADGAQIDIAPLGTRTPTIPSMVALRPDGTVLVGEAAERRAMSEPTRVAREFKRRLGDPVPIVLGGTPYGAETLMAHLLRSVVDQVAEQRGGVPERVVLTHPADYGPYKLDLLEQVGHLAGIDRVELLTEPEAAAVHYSGTQRIEPGEIVAVYDLGGGTFDAAVVRRAHGGFELAGTPDGMDRFGGIDIDEAVFAHVRDALGRSVEGLDAADPATTTALARLRDDCRAAKEALSADTEAVVPVMLPNVHTEVRLTRAELEDMVRPRLRETVDTLERVVQSAGLAWEDVSRVLLVGGSSRIPLVGEMVRAQSGRQVALDSHPKHAIALGAAAAGVAGVTRTGARAALREAPPAGPEPPTTEPPSGNPEPAAPEPAASAPRVETTRAPDRAPVRRWRAAILGGLVVAMVAIGLVAASLTGLLSGGGGGSPAPAVTEPPGSMATASDGPGSPPAASEASGPTQGSPELPAIVGEPPSQRVLALYVAGYGTPDFGHGCALWASAADAEPPSILASAFYPVLGPYDSSDQATIAQHMAWLRQAGIGGVVIPWTGADGPTAAALPALLELGQRYGVRVTLSAPLAGTTPDELTGLAEQMLSRIVDHPDCLRTIVPDRDGREPGRPLVVLVPGPDTEGPERWAGAIAAIRTMAGGTAVVIASTDAVWLEATAVDGLLGDPAEDDVFGWATGLPESAWYLPSLSPGAMSDALGAVDRGDGARYEGRWQRAVEPRVPTYFFVNSFNQWLQGTQIEPAAVDVPERPDNPYLTYAPLEPTGYLDLTRQLVDRMAR